MTPLAAPYPADTRAKGWRFELDYEQIDQSETWPIAAEVPMAQHALLMMWLVAWSKQVPCGSFPSDENSIRAACRIPPAVWAKCRAVLMRGWWLASDGRLYHDTLTKRVLEMVEYRRKTAKRVADFKAAKREQQDANALPPRERDAKNDTGTGTNLREEKEKAPRKRSADPECPADVDSQVWSDWLALRRKKRAPVTATVIDGAQSEAAKAGMGLDAFLRVWCRRGSQGLEADWLKPNEREGAMTFRERDAANAIERVKQTGGGLVHATPTPITRRNDALQEVFDATPRLVG